MSADRTAVAVVTVSTVVEAVALAVAAEREACAVVALNTCLGGDSCPCALQIAAAIRAGGEK